MNKVEFRINKSIKVPPKEVLQDVGDRIDQMFKDSRGVK